MLLCGRVVAVSGVDGFSWPGGCAVGDDLLDLAEPVSPYGPPLEVAGFARFGVTPPGLAGAVFDTSEHHGEADVLRFSGGVFDECVEFVAVPVAAAFDSQEHISERVAVVGCASYLASVGYEALGDDLCGIIWQSLSAEESCEPFTSHGFC